MPLDRAEIHTGSLPALGGSPARYHSPSGDRSVQAVTRQGVCTVAQERQRQKYEQARERGAKALDAYAQIAGLDPAARENRQDVLVALLTDLHALADTDGPEAWDECVELQLGFYADDLDPASLDDGT